MRQQGVPRFGISIRETFSSSVALAVSNEFGQGAVMQTSTVLQEVYYVAYRTVL